MGGGGAVEYGFYKVTITRENLRFSCDQDRDCPGDPMIQFIKKAMSEVL
jgi:hypothetical protein